MSARSRVSRRRSVLVVPGSSDRFLNKAPLVESDMVLLDLEDGVGEEAKRAARGRIADAITHFDWGERIVGVRVNGWASGQTLADLSALVSDAARRLDVVVLPKVRRSEEVVALELVLDSLERELGRSAEIGIEVLIETAPALSSVNMICASSPRLEAVAIGPGDLGAELGIPTLSLGSGRGEMNPYLHVLAAILVAARTSGLQAIDGAFGALDDEVGLRAASTTAMSFGCDGKWAIHPDQVGVINQTFTPDAPAVARAEAILTALADGAGAVRLDGDMVDAASARLARQVLRRAGRDGREPATPAANA